MHRLFGVALTCVGVAIMAFEMLYGGFIDDGCFFLLRAPCPSDGASGFDFDKLDPFVGTTYFACLH